MKTKSFEQLRSDYLRDLSNQQPAAHTHPGSDNYARATALAALAEGQLLREIMQTMHDDEEADFINAEKHKAAMLKAENPLEYDYSDGWTANYEQPAAELEEA